MQYAVRQTRHGGTGMLVPHSAFGDGQRDADLQWEMEQNCLSTSQNYLATWNGNSGHRIQLNAISWCPSCKMYEARDTSSLDLWRVWHVSLPCQKLVPTSCLYRSSNQWSCSSWWSTCHTTKPRLHRSSSSNDLDPSWPWCILADLNQEVWSPPPEGLRGSGQSLAMCPGWLQLWQMTSPLVPKNPLWPLSTADTHLSWCLR